MFSVFRSFWEPNVRRIEPAWPATDDMAEYRLPSETAREKKRQREGRVNSGSKKRRFREGGRDIRATQKGID